MQSLHAFLKDQFHIKFNNKDLCQQAFYHTSYVNENRRLIAIGSNERLEFLGDAVLEILVSDFLFNTYPNEPEGTLSRMRAQLVREDSLAHLARCMHFEDYLRLGKGELASHSNQKDSLLSDCFEAFLGALYLDQGMDICQAFLNQLFLSKHQQFLKSAKQDYKTQFQELVQEKGSVKIEYQLLEKSGPAHHQLFTVSLSLEGKTIAKASGYSKKEAEMLAAKEGIKVYLEGKDN